MNVMTKAQNLPAQSSAVEILKTVSPGFWQVDKQGSRVGSAVGFQFQRRMYDTLPLRIGQIRQV